MNKLLLLLLTNFIFAFSFSQNDYVKAIKKEYDVTGILSSTKLNHNSYLIIAEVRKAALALSMMFIVENKNEDYTVLKMEHSHSEVQKGLKWSYFKHDSQVYRCRQMDEKTETSFYIDKLSGNHFEESAKSFFKGSSDYAGGNEFFNNGKSFILTTQRVDHTVVKGMNSFQCVSALTISEFTFEDYELITTDVTLVPREHLVKPKDLYHFYKDQMLVYYYQYEEEEMGKVATIALSDGKATHLKLEDNSDKEITCSMYCSNKQLFLSVFTRNADNFKIQLYVADTKSSIFIKKTDSPLPIEVLSAGYSKPFEKKELKKRILTFNLSDAAVDVNGDVYLFYYSNELAEGFIPVFFDLLIVKFADNELAWTKLIRRDGIIRNNGSSPRPVLTEDELEIHDRDQKRINSKVVIPVEYIKIITYIDKESGDINPEK